MTPPRARLAAGLLGCAVLAAPAVARGATITVTSSADSGAGTLRAAITQANATTAPDVIVFDAALQDATIALDSALPNVTRELQIDGDGRNVSVEREVAMTLVTLDATAMSVQITDVNLAAGNVVVGEGVVFSLDQTVITPGTLPGAISGSGALEKLGPGVLILEGTNTYSGGTGVREGTLQGDATSLQGDIVVDSGTELVFDQADDGNYADVLSGEGRLRKIGSGILVLSGANTYSGTTFVDEGTLQGTATSLPGESDGVPNQFVVAAGAELVLNQTDTGTFAGDLSGDGTVTKRGAGALTLSGTNQNLLGDFVFEAGTLVVTTDSTPPVIVNNGADENDVVVIDQAFTGSFTGSITGVGGASSGFVAKRGSGNVSLGGGGEAGEIRAQLFTVEQGLFTLTQDGIFDGGFQLDSGATLHGESLAANVTGTATFAGTVLPGGAKSVAELHTGFVPATFQSSSTLQIDVIAPDAIDLFEAESIVVEEGAKLQLVLSGEPDFMGMSLPVVEASVALMCPGGNPFCFEFDQDPFFFEVIPTLSATELSLEIETVDNAFASFAQTQNELAVADVLDAAKQADELGDFFTAIIGMNKSQVPALLNAMSGEIATGFATPRLAAKQILDRSLELQVRGFASRAPGFVPVAAESSGAQAPGASLLGVGAAAGPAVRMAFTPEPGEIGFGAWLDGYGVFGTADGGNGGAGDLDYNVYGTTLGLDARLSEHFLVGVAGGYARVEPELRASSGTGDMGQGALFASAVWDRLYLAGWGRYAFGSYETRRPIGFGADVTAVGSFDGWDYSGHGEVGVRALDLAGFELRPLASIDYAHLEQDGYTEKGAVVGSDSLNLQVPSQSWNSLVSGVGARVHRVWELEQGAWFVPEIHARWLHEFEDTDRRVVPTLTGVDMAYLPFIQGAELDRNGLVAGLGWTVSSTEGLHVYGDYEVNWNPKLLQQSIKAGFRFLF